MGERSAGHEPYSLGSNLSGIDKLRVESLPARIGTRRGRACTSSMPRYTCLQVPHGCSLAGGQRRAVRGLGARPGPDAPGQLGLRARRAGGLRLPAHAAARGGQLRLQAVGRASGAGHPGARDVRELGRQLAGRLIAAGQPRLLRLHLQLRRPLGVVDHPGHRGHRRLGGAVGLVRDHGAGGDRRGQGRPGAAVLGPPFQPVSRTGGSAVIRWVTRARRSSDPAADRLIRTRAQADRVPASASRAAAQASPRRFGLPSAAGRTARAAICAPISAICIGTSAARESAAARSEGDPGAPPGPGGGAAAGHHHDVSHDSAAPRCTSEPAEKGGEVTAYLPA
jgi:hypothetical protein